MVDIVFFYVCFGSHNRYNYIIIAENLTVAHVYPPIVCHGSHGIEYAVARGQHRRPNGKFCCEDFYDLKHMHPRMIQMKLLPKLQMQ